MWTGGSKMAISAIQRSGIHWIYNYIILNKKHEIAIKHKIYTQCKHIFSVTTCSIETIKINLNAPKVQYFIKICS